MKSNRTLWIVLFVILLAFCLCCALTIGILVLRSINSGEGWVLGRHLTTSEQFTEEVSVQEPVVLRLTVPVGDLTVKTTDAEKVTVDATKRAWAGTQKRAQDILDNIDIRIDQSSESVDVVVSGLTGLTGVPRSPQVDMVVSVPVNTHLQIVSNVGRVRVAGLHGDIKIEADVGQVVLTDVTPAQRLEVTTRVASVEVEGILVPNSEYKLESDVGRIALTLPVDSSFKIDARSDVGDVRVGFPLVGRTSREGFVSKEVRGEVGKAPTSSLHLRSRVGDISVQSR